MANMVHILHGEDSKSSYTKLNLLIRNFPNHRRIHLSGKDITRNQFIDTLGSQNLFGEQELIIGQNLIKNKIAIFADFNLLSESKEIILWEDGELTSLQLSKFKTSSKIEIFKLPIQLYTFLDSVVPGSKQTFALLQNLKSEGQENICWQLSNRLFLLVLAKEGTNYEKASELASKTVKSRLFDWQWQKIKKQAYSFDLETLKSLFSGVLKIDFMLKNGSTSLDASTLISMLFLKYLKPQKNATINPTAHGRYSLV